MKIPGDCNTQTSENSMIQAGNADTKEKAAAPRFYEVYCTFNDMPSSDGWFHNDIKVRWVASDRDPKELLERIRLVNTHNLTGTPVTEIQNRDDDYDYSPDCVEECFDEAEMRELKRLLENHPRASSVEIYQCDPNFDYVPCLFFPLGGGGRLIKLEYQFKCKQNSIMLIGRFSE